VNRKRLYRSSDAIISGVCGGIAEYFGIDSNLVRIITVALTIVGFGIPAIFYVVCMVLLPPDPGIAQGYVDARAEATEAQRPRIDSSTATPSVEQPPPPDPATRASSPTPPRPSYNSSSSSASPATSPSSTGPIPRVADAAKNHSQAVLIIGAVLIGVGVITLLCNFIHISLWRFWPAVLVVVGVVCLFTPSSRGWSLERAGNSIVLITIGLALLAWMLQIIQTRVFIAAFMDLWPLFLIVLGLAVIGSVKKSSVIALSGSLVLSATILIGLWVYGGLDWANLGATAVLQDSDGFHELLADLRFGP